MPQSIVFLDELENEKINVLAKKWKKSKAESIRKVIREFED